jgi:DNA (cytosine-5)-methyltransferase 1
MATSRKSRPLAFRPRQDPISDTTALPVEAKGPQAICVNVDTKELSIITESEKTSHSSPLAPISDAVNAQDRAESLSASNSRRLIRPTGQGQSTFWSAAHLARISASPASERDWTARGQLTIEFLALAGRLRPRWLVWENVPGVLSADGGRAFGIFLGGLAKLGYGFAYRVLDAQYFGVPQRRRRVFVVGYLGDWRRAATVLFERASLSGNPAPRRETREDVAGSIGGGSGERGWCDDTDRMTFVPDVVGALNDGAHMGGGLNGQDVYSDQVIAFDYKQSGEVNPTLRSLAHDKSHANSGSHVAVAIQSVNMVRERKQNGIGISENDVMYSLTERDQHAVAFTERTRKDGRNFESQEELAYAVTNPGSGGRTHSRQLYQPQSGVRRLTPRECERLQGFPDDYTQIPYRGKLAADGSRYRALGNSMAVPVMAWIGWRIEMVEAICAAVERREREHGAPSS